MLTMRTTQQQFSRITVIHEIPRYKSRLLIGLSLIALSGGAWARDWYISGGGNDFNPGTKAQPFATINRAVYLSQPGDTIILRGGYYNVSHSNSAYMWKGGTANAWMTLRPEYGETAVLKSMDYMPCTGTNKNYVEIRNITCTGLNGIRADGNHVRIIGNRILDLVGTNGAGIAGRGSDVLIQDNTVERVRSSGIRVGNNAWHSTENVVIVGNTVRYSGMAWSNTSAQGGWPAGISIVGSTSGKIERNLVERTFGEGIACSLSDGCMVTKNTVWDAYNTLYHGDNVTNSVWDGNIGWTTGDSRFTRTYNNQTQFASGLTIGNEQGWFSGRGNASSANIACNNVFTNVDHGVQFLNYRDGDWRGVRNSLIANNTLYNTRLCGIHISEQLPMSGNRFANNIVVPSAKGAPACVYASGIAFDHNLWARGNPGSASGTGDVQALPQFFSYGTTPRQYALKPNSPGIDAGTRIGAVATDYTLNRRPLGRGQDMGAFENLSQ